MRPPDRRKAITVVATIASCGHALSAARMRFAAIVRYE